MSWSGNCAGIGGIGRSGMGESNEKRKTKNEKAAEGKRKSESRRSDCGALCRFSLFVLRFSFAYRLRRSRRALRFLLPTLRRRRGLAMGESPFNSCYRSSVRVSFISWSLRVAYRGVESESSRRGLRLRSIWRGKMLARAHRLL